MPISLSAVANLPQYSLDVIALNFTTEHHVSLVDDRVSTKGYNLDGCVECKRLSVNEPFFCPSFVQEYPPN